VDSKSSETTLSIGEVAARAGVRPSAIRFYEDRSVLPEPVRVSGRRRYTQETIRRLQVITIAQRAGFTLDDIRVLLAAAGNGTPAHEQLQALARRKLPEVEALIKRAEAMRDWLTTASGCGCETLDVCRLFDAEASDLGQPKNAFALRIAARARRLTQRAHWVSSSAALGRSSPAGRPGKDYAARSAKLPPKIIASMPQPTTSESRPIES
jgi:MerR family redox-sensitive transcriptional activator SoxR